MSLCGLFCVDKPNVNFSLQSLSVKCFISNMLVTCESDSVYVNDSDKTGEAKFTFPLHGNCVVYYLEATIGNKKLIGVCRELEEAQNLYEAAKDQAQKCAIIEQSRCMHDIFCCKIGNVPAKSEAKIRLKFLFELQISLTESNLIEDTTDKFDLVLPLILRPRWIPNGDSTESTEIYRVEKKFQFDFLAIVEGTRQVVAISSNNYKLKTTINGSSSAVTLEKEYSGKFDLDLLLEYEGVREPCVLYEAGQPDADTAFFRSDVAMLNFLPRFQRTQTSFIKFEVVFIVDRSGSMSGSNMSKAKECLLFFIKSLPRNCKFQIYGFGSHFNKSFPMPEIYTPESLRVGLRYQAHLQADMGGREILEPLLDMYASTLTADYTRLAFLLTDGNVINQPEVCRVVRQHSGSTRVFTVGIGHSVSPSLVTEVAQAGGGKAVFVRDSCGLSEKVLALLDLALNCCSVQLEPLQFPGLPAHISVQSVPSCLPHHAFSDHFLTILLVVNGVANPNEARIRCCLVGRIHGSDKPVKWELELVPPASHPDDDMRLHRLAAIYRAREIARQLADIDIDSVWEEKQIYASEMVQLSIAANIVTDRTTFVVLDSEPVAQLTPPPRYVFKSQEDLKDDMDISTLKSKKKSGFFAGFSLGRRSSKHKSIPTLNFNKKKDRLANVQTFDESPTAPRKKSDPMLAEKDPVLYVADVHAFEGYWEWEEEVLRTLKIDSELASREKPGDATENAWMTVLMYEYLRRRHTDREAIWRLLVRKALAWLHRHIEDDMDADFPDAVLTVWMMAADTVLTDIR